MQSALCARLHRRRQVNTTLYSYRPTRITRAVYVFDNYVGNGNAAQGQRQILFSERQLCTPALTTCEGKEKCIEYQNLSKTGNLHAWHLTPHIAYPPGGLFIINHIVKSLPPNLAPR
jgi:hypothetical protein